MNLNETAQALILLNRAHSAAQTAAIQAHLPPPQFNLTEVSDTVARAHQFRELVVREGPAVLPNFRARRWVFHIRGRRMRLSLHNYDSPAQRIMVLNEIEFLLRCAFQKCIQDGAAMTDIVHFYLECGGLDFSFCFNPSGPYGVTIGNILLPDGLRDVLERFAAMLQSGKDVFIDEHTIL